MFLLFLYSVSLSPPLSLHAAGPKPCSDHGKNVCKKNDDCDWVKETCENKIECPAENKDHYLYNEADDDIKELLQEYFGFRIPSSGNVCPDTGDTAAWVTPFDICVLILDKDYAADYEKPVADYCESQAATAALGFLALASTFFDIEFDPHAVERAFHFKQCLDKEALALLWGQGHCHDDAGLPWYSEMREGLLFCADSPATPPACAGISTVDPKMTNTNTGLSEAPQNDVTLDEFFERKAGSPIGIAFSGCVSCRPCPLPVTPTFDLLAQASYSGRRLCAFFSSSTPHK